MDAPKADAVVTLCPRCKLWPCLPGRGHCSDVCFRASLAADSSSAALAEGVRVRSVALPHREGVVEEVEVRTIVAVKWDDGGRSNHAAGALQAAPFTSAGEKP